MKNKLALILILSPLFCLAQGSVVAHMPGALTNSTSNLIKDYKNYSTIVSSFVEGYDVNLISYQYHNNLPVSYHKLLSNYHIYDFEISNDSVFFCGVNLENNRGIIGFFDIEGFFFGTDSATIFHQFLVEDGTVVSFSKLTTYKDILDVRHIVCIGTAINKRGVANSCIVDAYTNLMGNYTFYQSGVVQWLDDETFVDVAHVEDYVVTVGFTADTNLSLRVYDQNDLFYTNLYINRHEYSPSGYGHRKWYYGNIILTPTIDGKFITAATWRVLYPIMPEVNRIHLAEFDISALVTSSTTSMTQSKDMIVDSCPNYTTLYHMVHNIRKHKIGLLFKGDRSSLGGIENSYFFEINRDLSSVTTGMMAANSDDFCPDSQLQGLDTYNSNNNYVMLGYCETGVFPNHNFIFNVEKSGQASQCRPVVNASLLSLKPIISIIQKNNLSLKKSTLISYKLKPVTDPVGITIDCNE